MPSNQPATDLGPRLGESHAEIPSLADPHRSTQEIRPRYMTGRWCRSTRQEHPTGAPVTRPGHSTYDQGDYPTEPAERELRAGQPTDRDVTGRVEDGVGEDGREHSHSQVSNLLS